MYRILRTSRCESGAISAVIPLANQATGPNQPGGSGAQTLQASSTSCRPCRCASWAMVADRENAALAATLIEETCLKQGISPRSHAS